MVKAGSRTRERYEFRHAFVRTEICCAVATTDRRTAGDGARPRVVNGNGSMGLRCGRLWCRNFSLKSSKVQKGKEDERDRITARISSWICDGRRKSLERMAVVMVSAS